MSQSAIEWTQMTWNPVTGCTKVSEGCKNCYAIPMSYRNQNNPNTARKYQGTVAKMANGEKNFTGVVHCHEDELKRPFTWKKPRLVFVNSMSDLFHPKVPDDFIVKVFAVMAANPQHTFQILTKRPERMKDLMNSTNFKGEVRAAYEINQKRGTIKTDQQWPGLPLFNVWLGTTIESTKQRGRLDHLAMCSAAVRFISAEPLLAPLPLVHVDKIDWVIAGGESGANARPCHPNDVIHLLSQCQLHKIPFFFKQWGEWMPVTQMDIIMTLKNVKESTSKGDMVWYKVGKKAAGNEINGEKWEQMPETTEVSYD